MPACYEQAAIQQLTFLLQPLRRATWWLLNLYADVAPSTLSEACLARCDINALTSVHKSLCHLQSKQRRRARRMELSRTSRLPTWARQLRSSLRRASSGCTTGRRGSCGAGPSLTMSSIRQTSTSAPLAQSSLSYHCCGICWPPLTSIVDYWLLLSAHRPMKALH